MTFVFCIDVTVALLTVTSTLLLKNITFDILIKYKSKQKKKSKKTQKISHRKFEILFKIKAH